MDYAPFSVGEDEDFVDNEVEFCSACARMGAKLNPEGELLRAVLTLSPSKGLIWRADYAVPGDAGPVVTRFVCWQLPGHEKGKGGFILQDAIVDRTIDSLPTRMRGIGEA